MEITMRSTQLFKWFLSLLAIFLLVACGGDEAQIDMNTIRVGVIIGGAEEKLLEVVKKAAIKEYDLKIKIIPYTYARELNKALSNHEIDANVFQYESYLEYSQEKHGYHLLAIGTTYIYPMGVYSHKITNILQLKRDSIVAIPDEPTNQARALFLLSKAGLIRMKSEKLDATVDDIAANPSNFQFKALPANQLTNVLPNVDIAVINAGFALSSGLVPSKNALVIENENSDYANVIVVREDEASDPRMKAFVEIFHSEVVQKAAEEIFKGQAIPAWK